MPEVLGTVITAPAPAPSAPAAPEVPKLPKLNKLAVPPIGKKTTAPAAEPKAPEEAAAAPIPTPDLENAPMAEDDEAPKPSITYLVVAALALLSLIYVALLAGVHYTELVQKSNVLDGKIPSLILPTAKK